MVSWLRAGVPADPSGYAAYRQENPGPFFFRPSIRQALLERFDSRRVVAEAEAVLGGTYQVFGGVAVKRGFPPDWFHFLPPLPPAAQLSGPRKHWSEFDLESGPGDIKLVWELSRFSWLLPLARAYVWTEDDRYPEAAWKLVDAWMCENPPNTSPHWVSAQECAFRVLAAAFAWQAFRPWRGLDPHRPARLAAFIAEHAARINATLLYARAQGNNHLLVEAAGLLTASVCLPEFKSAAGWRAQGKHWLEHGLRTQFFSDGGYVQHSANYQRLALEAGLWGARLLEEDGEQLSAECLDALRRGASALDALADTETGVASNFGPNDGAHLLRLTDCDFADVRPTLQLAGWVLEGEPHLPPGPYDELALWMGVGSLLRQGDERNRPAASASTNRGPRDRSLGGPPPGLDLPEAGLQRLEGKASWGLLRCARFRGRPGHSDQLQFGLHWRGLPIVRDAGSFLYAGEPPWDNALSAASAHNGPVVDGKEPMVRAGRFLWLRWSKGRVVGRWRHPDGQAEMISAEHDGYRRLGVTCRRSVLYLGEDTWWVIDDILGGGEHLLALGWKLPDGEGSLQGSSVSLATSLGPVGVEMNLPLACTSLYHQGRCIAGQGSDQPNRGWYSPTYSVLAPALELFAEQRADLPARLVTEFELGRTLRPKPVVTWAPLGQGLSPLRTVTTDTWTWDLV